MIDQVVRNLRKPNGDDVDEDGVAVAILAVVVSAITVDRLKKFAKAIRWFADVSRTISPETMTVSVSLILDKAIDSLLDKRKNDSSNVPKYDPKFMSLLLHHDLILLRKLEQGDIHLLTFSAVNPSQVQIRLHLSLTVPTQRTMVLFPANPSLGYLTTTHSLVMTMQKSRNTWKKHMSALMFIQL